MKNIDRAYWAYFGMMLLIFIQFFVGMISGVNLFALTIILIILYMFLFWLPETFKKEESVKK
jgi:hypothetical protein